MYFKVPVFSIPSPHLMAAVVSLALVSCEQSKSPTPSSGSPASTTGSSQTTDGTNAQPSGAGTVSGVALFAKGDIPVMQAIEVKADVQHCGGKVAHENRIVNATNRGLKNVVVTVEGVQGGKAAEPTTLTVANKGCVFVPHVSAVIKGSKMRVTNEDPILHTTHPYQQNRTLFNLPIAPNADPPVRPLRRAGVVKLKCDVHDWMIGWVVVHDTSYFAVSDADGKFEIGDVPAGTYTLKAWHEDLGGLTSEIEIKDGATSAAKFEFSGS